MITFCQFCMIGVEGGECMWSISRHCRGSCLKVLERKTKNLTLNNRDSSPNSIQLSCSLSLSGNENIWTWRRKRGNNKRMEKFSLWGVHNLCTFKNSVSVFVSGATAQLGPRPPRARGFWIKHIDTPQSVGILWTRDRPVAETSVTTHDTQKNRHPCPRAGFEPANPASDRSQILALDRSATGLW